jgi:hypothetical protein
MKTGRSQLIRRFKMICCVLRLVEQERKLWPISCSGLIFFPAGEVKGSGENWGGLTAFEEFNSNVQRKEQSVTW